MVHAHACILLDSLRPPRNGRCECTWCSVVPSIVPLPPPPQHRCLEGHKPTSRAAHLLILETALQVGGRVATVIELWAFRATCCSSSNAVLVALRLARQGVGAQGRAALGGRLDSRKPSGRLEGQHRWDGNF